MPVNRGIWLILAAVVLVVIGLYVWPTVNRTPEAPPAAQAPAAATGAQPSAEKARSAGPAQSSEQKSASAAAPEAAQSAQKETAPAPQTSAAPSQNAEKETAPAPRPTIAPPSQTAEKEAAPAPAAEAAPSSAPQPGAAPTPQTAEKESAPASAPSPATPAAPAGEKAPAATDKDAEQHANDKASAELAALKPGFDPKDLVAALNDSAVSFASDSAEVPASATDFLQKAAEDLKQLPIGHVVEIAGHTDNTGGEALNLALSEKRAEAVRQTLIKFGADPEMLIAKGYGSADPVASNDTPEGRGRNRRIEYHIIKAP